MLTSWKPSALKMSMAVWLILSRRRTLIMSFGNEVAGTLTVQAAYVAGRPEGPTIPFLSKKLCRGVLEY